MPGRWLFRLSTPLGYRVVLSRNRWREIVRFKHPALAGHEEEVLNCLREPEVIRSSTKDRSVHLFYRATKRGYVCAVVAGDDPNERFVVSAYFTKVIKKGQELWTK